MYNLMLVDDHALFRAGIRALLNAESDMCVVAEAADGHAAIRLADHDPLDTVVLDLSMPGGLSGPRTAEELLALKPLLKIVVLTMHDEPHYLKELFAIGAHAFVLKHSRPEVLVSAVRAAHRGQRYVDPALMGGFIDAYVGGPQSDEPVRRAGQLSEREREVCRFIALGHTNREVGELLHISARTVESHRRNIMARLDLKSRAQLVRFALDNGVISSGA